MDVEFNCHMKQACIQHQYEASSLTAVAVKAQRLRLGLCQCHPALCTLLYPALCTLYDGAYGWAC